MFMFSMVSIFGGCALWWRCLLCPILKVVAYYFAFLIYIYGQTTVSKIRIKLKQHPSSIVSKTDFFKNSCYRLVLWNHTGLSGHSLHFNSVVKK